MTTKKNQNNPGARKPVRCAVYTRKSTEERTEQEFTSLQAQREAAEAFIKSQAGEGWICLPEHYDDGGCSGGNMDRPALARLLADIDAGKIDAVVVHRVNRLSRSLLVPQPSRPRILGTSVSTRLRSLSSLRPTLSRSSLPGRRRRKLVQRPPRPPPLSTSMSRLRHSKRAMRSWTGRKPLWGLTLRNTTPWSLSALGEGSNGGAQGRDHRRS
jgi:Resolvase, N terminal domain